MEVLSWARALLFSLLAVSGLTVSGCGGGSGAKGPQPGRSPAPADDSSCSLADNWCIEHGVPEDICGQCNAKVAADCKRKGDWCKEHDRPELQCFLCNPKLEAKFAAEYEAKYGKKPPRAQEK